MTWNYRLVKENGKYTIREVYYREDGKITGLTENSINFIKQLSKDIWWYIKGFYEAITNPILKYEEIEFVDREFPWTKDIEEATELDEVKECLIELMSYCEGLLSNYDYDNSNHIGIDYSIDLIRNSLEWIKNETKIDR